jgi:hypothetical protein
MKDKRRSENTRVLSNDPVEHSLQKNSSRLKFSKILSIFLYDHYIPLVSGVFENVMVVVNKFVFNRCGHLFSTREYFYVLLCLHVRHVIT